MNVGLDFLSDVAGVSSGATTYMYGFLKALEALPESRNNNYYLFINKGNVELFHSFNHSPFHLVYIPGSNHKRVLRVIIQNVMIPFYTRRLRLDVVDFFGTTGVPGIQCAVVQHVKSLHHLLVPDQIDQYTAMFRTFAMRSSIQRADIVLANTQSTSSSIRRFFNVLDNRIIIVPEAVDTKTFYPFTGPNDKFSETLQMYGINRPYILFVSTLWPYKNAGGLISAFAKLSSQVSIPHCLVIVGGDWKGERKRLEALTTELGVQERVKFTGHISDRHQVRDMYVGADVFVYPSLCETFGLTLLEAMSCGVSIVASDRTAVPETTGDAGLLVNPEDTDAMADAIIKLLSDHDLRNLLIARGYQRVHTFTWERTAQDTLQAWLIALNYKKLGGFSHGQK